MDIANIFSRIELVAFDDGMTNDRLKIITAAFIEDHYQSDLGADQPVLVVSIEPPPVGVSRARATNPIRLIKAEVPSKPETDDVRLVTLGCKHLIRLFDDVPMQLWYKGAQVLITASDNDAAVIKNIHETVAAFRARRAEAELSWMPGQSERAKTPDEINSIVEGTPVQVDWPKFQRASENPDNGNAVRFAYRWAALMRHEGITTGRSIRECAEVTSHSAADRPLSALEYGFAIGLLKDAWPLFGPIVHKWHEEVILRNGAEPERPSSTDRNHSQTAPRTP